MNRWDKMYEPWTSGHLVLVAAEAKIEYSPCELGVRYHLELTFKGRETVSGRMMIYLKENSYLV